jgi:aspartate aminotransferase-like enzyme
MFYLLHLCSHGFAFPRPARLHTNLPAALLTSYHHTGMVSMWYAMREALAIVGEEGLEGMWARHLKVI